LLFVFFCPNKQSDSDPIPTWLLKECSSFLVPTMTNIVNLFLISGQFHPTLNESIISPLLKKPTLDKELSNYRSISNLSIIFKIIERVVKSRLMDNLTSNSLLNSHQSAYCKHHSTETALLYTHDHLISAIGSQKVSCLCLLDLSAAFDTIDHDILITRLSSMVSMALFSAGSSHLSSRCFRVKCETDLSSWYSSSCGVPKALSLVHYFSSCTPLLSVPSFPLVP